MTKKIYKVAVVEADGTVSNIILAEEGYLMPEGQTGIVLAEMIDDANATPVHAGAMPSIGWLWDGAAFVPKPVSHQALLDHLASVRYQREVGGLVIDGARYPTDRQFRAALMEILTMIAMRRREDHPIVLKACGNFVELANAAALHKVSTQIRGHVQACFDKEREVHDKITKGLISKIVEIDDAFI